MEEDEETTLTITGITSNFRDYLDSEIRAHQKVSQKNFKTFEAKLQTFSNHLDKLSANDVILDGLLKQKDEIIGCKKVPVKQKEQAQLLREQREQERELSNLKAKLIELEKQKKAYEEANKGLLQETKEVLVALEKAVKKYSKSFLMDLSVESGEDAITCKIRFNEQPECCAFFEIDRKRKEVISFHTRGLPTSVGNQLEQKFAKHRNTSQILVDFRNVIMKM